MKTKLLLMMTLSGLLIISSCTKYPNETERLTEDLVVITQYDTKADFSQYQTYAISDQIMKITDKDTVPVNNAEASACLAQIAENMEERGYVPVTDPQLPDLGITVVYYQNTNIYAYYPDYYWGYPYYGWGWYYPYYPVYYSSYTTGALNITMVDLKFEAPNDQLYVRWNAYIRGLLTGYHTLSEVTNAIDQAFIQTPQLQK